MTISASDASATLAAVRRHARLRHAIEVPEALAAVLALALKTGDLWTACAAAEGLAELGDPRVVESLTAVWRRAVSAADLAVALRAACELARRGDPAFLDDLLPRALAARDVRVAYLTARALVGAGRRRSTVADQLVDIAHRALHGGQLSIAHSAAIGVAELGDRNAGRRLLVAVAHQAADNGAVDTVLSCARDLYLLGDRASASALLPAPGTLVPDGAQAKTTIASVRTALAAPHWTGLSPAKLARLLRRPRRAAAVLASLLAGTPVFKRFRDCEPVLATLVRSADTDAVTRALLPYGYSALSQSDLGAAMWAAEHLTPTTAGALASAVWEQAMNADDLDLAVRAATCASQSDAELARPLLEATFGRAEEKRSVGVARRSAVAIAELGAGDDARAKLERTIERAVAAGNHAGAREAAGHLLQLGPDDALSFLERLGIRAAHVGQPTAVAWIAENLLQHGRSGPAWSMAASVWRLPGAEGLRSEWRLPWPALLATRLSGSDLEGALDDIRSAGRFAEDINNLRHWWSAAQLCADQRAAVAALAVVVDRAVEIGDAWDGVCALNMLIRLGSRPAGAGATYRRLAEVASAAGDADTAADASRHADRIEWEAAAEPAANNHITHARHLIAELSGTPRHGAAGAYAVIDEVVQSARSILEQIEAGNVVRARTTAVGLVAATQRRCSAGIDDEIRTLTKQILRILMHRANTDGHDAIERWAGWKLREL